MRASRTHAIEFPRPVARALATLAALVLAPPGLGCSASAEAPRLLVLISVDTLRADRLGAYGSALGLTPHLDTLAGRSQVFEAAYSPTSFTLPSVSSLLTGHYPEELGIQSNRSALRADTPTLATLLRGHGWSTGAVVSNFVLRRNSGLAAGFDLYDDELPQREAVRNWPERIAADTTDASLIALDSLLARGAPGSFLWIHYQDPHGPYTPPGDWRARFLDLERAAPDGRRRLPVRAGKGGHGTLPSYQEVEGRREVAFYRAGYDGEVAYLDAEIGRLLNAFEARGVAERMILIFTADHGEALGEGDYWFAHGDRLSDPLVRVPLWIRAPGLEPKRRQDVAALVDLLPTALRLAVGETVPGPGRDLLGPGAEYRPSVPYLATLRAGPAASFGIVEGPHKLVIQRRDGGWVPALTRRDADGVERADRSPEIEARLTRRLERFREQLPRGEPELRQRLSEADRERLRALGYTEDAREGE